MDDSRHPIKFPYLTLPPPPPATMTSPDHYYSSGGMATPPLHTLASVPFKWEEQPGKPRPCTQIILRPEPALELPPYMQQPSRFPKMLSPTTVLDGPGRPTKSSSFRLFRDSFDSSSCSGSGSPHSAVDVLLAKKKTRGFFGRFKKVDPGGSFGIPRTRVKMRRSGSFSSLSETPSTHLWVTVYKSLRQAMPWRSTRKSKKEGAQCFI